MCEAVGIVGYLSSGHGRALSVWPLYPKVGGWWCDGAVLCPMAARSLRRGESHFCFHPQIPPKTLEPAPTEGTARWHSASPSHTHASGSYAQPHRSSVREHHRRATGTKRVSFSQSVRKASVCHHDPLLLAQCAAVCLLSADLPHPHQRELPVSLHASKSVDFGFVRCEAKVCTHLTRISFWCFGYVLALYKWIATFKRMVLKCISWTGDANTPNTCLARDLLWNCLRNIPKEHVQDSSWNIYNSNMDLM